jgi:hypothetical protein
MLWSEPWLELAASPAGTLIPPPRQVLPSGWHYERVSATAGITADWLDFVGAGLPVEAACQRVGRDASVACLFVKSVLVATCILRPVADRVWSLETFVARPRRRRYGEWLLRCVMRDLWAHRGAALVFQWEIAGLPALLGAAWRGWIRAARRIDYGWRWRRAAEAASCGFCPVTAAWLPSVEEKEKDEVVVEGVLVVDSGLCDGWGYVLDMPANRTGINWTRVAAAGGWRELWWAGAMSPGAEWHWTGEWIVHGRVGLPPLANEGEVENEEERSARPEIPFRR